MTELTMDDNVRIAMIPKERATLEAERDTIDEKIDNLEDRRREVRRELDALLAEENKLLKKQAGR